MVLQVTRYPIIPKEQEESVQILLCLEVKESQRNETSVYQLINILSVLQTELLLGLEHRWIHW